MKKLLVIMIFLSALNLPACAQVDSLRLSFLRGIQLPSRLRESYFADIQGNGVKELIACGDSNIYAYNCMNGDLLWTSPPLARYGLFTFTYPWKIVFHDMNSDGILDLVVRDTMKVHIFDVVDSQVIWESRDLTQSRVYFALGDINSDSIQDIVLACRDPYRNDLAPDTTWIEIYDGPNFQLSQRFPVLVSGYADYCADVIEEPSTFAISKLSGMQGLETKLILFTSIEYYCPADTNGWPLWWASGNVKIIDPLNYNVTSIESTGSVQYFSTRQIVDGSTRMYAVTKKHFGLGELSYDNVYSLVLSADSLVDLNHLCFSYMSRFGGPLVGEIDPDNSGDELGFGVSDSLELLSFPALTPIWARQVDFMVGNNLYLFHAASIFPSPQLLSLGANELFDGIDGHLSAYLLLQGAHPTGVADIDNDGDDEFYENNWIGSVSFYRIQRQSNGINEMPTLPLEFRLYSNYPNPFNSSTVIEYDLAVPSEVSIGIFDILGRRIETIAQGSQPAGPHSVIWDATGQSSGIYFYRIKAGDKLETRKMVLIK